MMIADTWIGWLAAGGVIGIAWVSQVVYAKFRAWRRRKIVLRRRRDGALTSVVVRCDGEVYAICYRRETAAFAVLQALRWAESDGLSFDRYDAVTMIEEISRTTKE